MDILLQKVTQQAMNYAIRSGIAITSGYAINQCGRLLKTVKTEQKDELSRLQLRLDSKIRIIAPAIDMIELIAARGNTSLESAVNLTKSLRWDIQSLGVRLSKAAADDEARKCGSSSAKSQEQMKLEVQLIIKDMSRLLERIEDAVPFINLAITTSGVSLSTNLPPSISPSRLLQASTLLSAGDSQYSSHPRAPTQIGPRFTLSLYMLFLGHSRQAADDEGFNKTVWKEVIHKAQVKLVRVPIDKLNHFPLGAQHEEADGKPTDQSGREYDEQSYREIASNEFAYHLTLIEDLDDDRVHTFEDDEAQPKTLDDVSSAGIRTFVPIHEVAKIFYADTGKILNLGSEGEANNPILLLKRDPTSPAPRRLIERAEQEWDLIEEDEHVEDRSVASPESSVPPTPTVKEEHRVGQTSTDAKGLPAGLDPEWIALEVYHEGSDDDESDDEGETPSKTPQQTQAPKKRSSLASAFTNLRLSHRNTITNSDSTPEPNAQVEEKNPPPQATQSLVLGASGPVTTSLSLLEMLIRLASLQQFQQCSHLGITDELLNFFLSEGSTTGAASEDAEGRKRIRMQARQHVGFDPYDESPIKRRGELYQAQGYGREYGTEDGYPESPKWSRSPTSSAIQSPLPPSRSLTGTPRDTPPLPRQNSGGSIRKQTLPITPPGTNSSRHRALQKESFTRGGSVSSPLSKQGNGVPFEDQP